MAETPIPPETEREETSAYLRSAKQYMDEGSNEQAILMLKAALMLEPNNPQILIKLAVAYFTIEKYDEAGPLLQRAHQLDPSEPDAVLGLGDFYVCTRRWDEALEQIGTLYPLHQGKAFVLFRDILYGFNDLLFERLFEISSKHANQAK